MIKHEDISVVIQGAYSSNVINLVNDLKSSLRNSEIILSTWENTLIDDCLNDIKIIFNKDPGPLPDKLIINSKNNMNRQIISTINGIKASSRKYILKIRTDAIINNLGFIKAIEFYGDDYLVIPSSVSCNLEYYNYPFLLSDVSVFGKKSNVFNLWNVDLIKSNCMSSKSSTLDTIKNIDNKLCLSFYGSEQYLWIHYWNLLNPIYISTKEFEKEYKRFIAKNIIILDNDYYGVGNVKYPNWYSTVFKGEYNYKIWSNYYKKYVKKEILDFGIKKYKNYPDIIIVKVLKILFGRKKTEKLLSAIKKVWRN